MPSRAYTPAYQSPPSPIAIPTEWTIPESGLLQRGNTIPCAVFRSTIEGHVKGVDRWELGLLIYEILAGYPPFYDENTFGTNQKFISGRIEFPRHFDFQAKYIARKLLAADRSKHLGKLDNGSDDIKKH